MGNVACGSWPIVQRLLTPKICKCHGISSSQFSFFDDEKFMRPHQRHHVDIQTGGRGKLLNVQKLDAIDRRRKTRADALNSGIDLFCSIVLQEGIEFFLIDQAHEKREHGHRGNAADGPTNRFSPVPATSGIPNRAAGVLACIVRHTSWRDQQGPIQRAANASTRQPASRPSRAASKVNPSILSAEGCLPALIAKMQPTKTPQAAATANGIHSDAESGILPKKKHPRTLAKDANTKLNNMRRL